MTDDPVNQAIEAILAPNRAEVPTHRWNHWRATFERTTLFGRRTGSISFIASLPDDERAKALEDARALAAGGPVTVPYRTEVQIAARR